MYVDFYKLKAAPFQLTPDPRFFFSSTVHTRAKAYLTYGLKQEEGFIIVTGDVGAGKTILVSHLLSTLDTKRYVAATLVTTQLDADNILRMVSNSFGLESESADKATLLQRIEAFLLEQRKVRRRALLVVDEAQNLSFEALEELRMLSNFQTEGQALLQIFLLGQPQFRRTLANPNLDQFRQRVIASYHLGPVSAEETEEYVRHRLGSVDWVNDPEFSSEAFSEIYRFSGGVPRRINMLCSRLLLYGFLEEIHHLDAASVIQVAEDLQTESELILDHTPDAPRSDSPVSTGAELVKNVEISMIKKQLSDVESKLKRRDSAFRLALVMLSQYLEFFKDDEDTSDKS